MKEKDLTMTDSYKIIKLITIAVILYTIIFYTSK